VSVAGCSVLGHRKENQDAYGLFTFPLLQSEAALLVVCDGVGGEASGQRASKEAIKQFAQLAPAITHLGEAINIKESLHNAVNSHFQATVRAFGSLALNENLVGLTTTVVAALAHEDLLAYWWAGDSRAYLLRNGKLKLLTRDHSVAVERLNVDPLDVLDHEDKSRLTRVLQPDAVNSPDFGIENLKDGDLVMLCSDGVWESCNHNELQGVANYYLLSDLPLDRIATHILNALALNTSDNATLALYRHRGTSQPHVLLHPAVLVTKGLRKDFLQSLYETDGETSSVSSNHIVNLRSSPPETVTETVAAGALRAREISAGRRSVAICIGCGRVVSSREKCCEKPDLHSGFYAIVTDSNGQVRCCRISNPDATIIGRLAGTDGINVGDDQVATEHLKIELNEVANEVLFKDLDSDNGSFLSISSHRLSLADLSKTVLQLGTSRIQVLHTALLENVSDENPTLSS
jgi:protein phosphatase